MAIIFGSVTKARWVMAGLAVAVSALLCNAATQATAAGLKCEPTVKVTNSKGASIKVLKFKYKVAGSTDTFTESLINKRLAPNETEEWPSQKLGHAATGIVITSTAVEYKDDNSGAGDGYGPPRTSDWFPHTFTCGANHNYIHTVE